MDYSGLSSGGLDSCGVVVLIYLFVTRMSQKWQYFIESIRSALDYMWVLFYFMLHTLALHSGFSGGLGTIFDDKATKYEVKDDRIWWDIQWGICRGNCSMYFFVLEYFKRIKRHTLLQIVWWWRTDVQCLVLWVISNNRLEMALSCNCTC